MRLGQLGIAEYERCQRDAACCVQIAFPHITHARGLVVRWHANANTRFSYATSPGPGRPTTSSYMDQGLFNAACEQAVAPVNNKPAQWTSTAVAKLPAVRSLMRQNTDWLTVPMLMVMMQSSGKVLVLTPKTRGILRDELMATRLWAGIGILSQLGDSDDMLWRVVMFDETSIDEETLAAEPPQRIAIEPGTHCKLVLSAHHTAAGVKAAKRKYSWLSVINALVGHVALVWIYPTPGCAPFPVRH